MIGGADPATCGDEDTKLPWNQADSSNFLHIRAASHVRPTAKQVRCHVRGVRLHSARLLLWIQAGIAEDAEEMHASSTPTGLGPRKSRAARSSAK
jgi:hypothetical protein